MSTQRVHGWRPFLRPAVWTLVIAYLAWSLIAGVVGAASSHGWPGIGLYLLLFAIGLAFCVVPYRRNSLRTSNLWWLAGAAVVALGMTVLVDFGGVGLLFLVVWVAPFRLRLRHVVPLTVALAGGFIAVSSAMALPQAATFGIAVGFGWAALLAAILHQLAVTRQQSTQVAAAQADAAVLNERQRLAREVHDILAHSLSAQVLHLEGAKLLLEHDGDPALALDRVVRAGDLARGGLEDTRRAVAALRGDQTPLAEQLERLANQFSTATGRPCELVLTGDTARLAPEAWLAVVRTAQEALTNVHKHAPEAQVTLELQCDGKWCELQVRDTGGHAGDLAAAGSGYGLVGMRERAELIGGTLDAGPDGGGFRVRLRVPA